jgi:hypothetical protein
MGNRSNAGVCCGSGIGDVDGDYFRGLRDLPGGEPMSEFTKGPWKVDDRKTISYMCMEDLHKDAWPFAINAPVGMALGSVVAAVPRDSLAGNHAANARLIAAAPELLEALKTMLNCEEVGEAECQRRGLPRLSERRAMARKAIAKAEGK